MHRTPLKIENSHDYYLKNCTVVQGAYLPVIESGYVRVKDGLFAEVGSGSPPDHAGLNLIDAQGAILVPGFLNIHTHCALAVARGRFHGSDNMVQDFFFPLESKMRPEDMEDLSYPYMMSALASGTTLIADHYYHAGGTAKAADRLGIRAAIAACIMDLDGAHLTKDASSGYAEFEKSFAWSERVFPIVGPHATDTCSKSLLAGLAKIASAKKLPVHMHLSQTQSEYDACMKKYGMTPVQLAHDLGLVHANSILVHLISATQKDFELIREAGATAVACPSSQVIYEHMLDPKLLQESKVEVALATDCAASNDTADLYAEMRTYALLSKSKGVQWSADELLAMVTLNPARALGLQDKLGSIEVGKWADFQLVQRGPEITPFLFPKQDLIYSMSTRLISAVVVGGKVLYQNGEFLTVDSINRVDQFQKRTADLLKRAGLS